MSIKQARLIVNAHKHNLLKSFCNKGYVVVLYSFTSPPPGQPHAVLGGFEGFFIFGWWMLLGKVLKLKVAEAI